MPHESSHIAHHSIPADLQDATQALLDRMARDDIVGRIRERDHTVWAADPTEIANRLGWLDSPTAMVSRLTEIDEVIEAVRADGYTHALLMGMGGSSLAPEVFRKVFDVADGFLDLAVLDSTDPEAVRFWGEHLDPARTLFIPATKSGGTVETISFLKYFYNLTANAVGEARVGEHFVAITDPESGLADLAGELEFRHIFLNDPDIGGRYSALSMFGLVPARLIGVDLARLLGAARAAAEESVSGASDGALVLGAAMAAGVPAGRDKLTLVLSPTISPLGPWIEQLVAESTGKAGKGILPVEGEAVAAPGTYGDDRLFVYLRLAGEDGQDNEMAELAAAGHPVLYLEAKDTYELGAEMFRWEMATIVAGHCMGINPFDQPDVEAAKILGRTMTEAYLRDGILPAVEPALTDGELSVYGDVPPDASLPEALRSFFASFADAATDRRPRRYISLHMYARSTMEIDCALAKVRSALRERLGLATTVGYGPRFLHSTGQLHKGDAGRGVFLQFTCDDAVDARIPDTAGDDSSHMTFGVLKAAQAMGDEQALRNAGRKILRVGLGSDVVGGLERVLAALSPEDHTIS